MLRGVFVQGSRGGLFCCLRVPDGVHTCPTVMVAPAFGDEMNKTRRMLTETGKRLNEAGIALINPDLYGTGDSEGAFEDADWNGWLDDLARIDRWARDEGLDVRGLIGVRTGALLAADFATRRGEPVSGTVLWQPVETGTAFVRQILRMRTMARAVNEGIRESVDDLIRQLQAGETVYAGGYALTERVLGPLLALELDDVVTETAGGMHVLEVTSASERWGDSTITLAGREADRSILPGEPYWNATETVCNASIVERSAGTLARWFRGPS